MDSRLVGQNATYLRQRCRRASPGRPGDDQLQAPASDLPALRAVSEEDVSLRENGRRLLPVTVLTVRLEHGKARGIGRDVDKDDSLSVDLMPLRPDLQGFGQPGQQHWPEPGLIQESRLLRGQGAGRNSLVIDADHQVPAAHGHCPYMLGQLNLMALLQCGVPAQVIEFLIVNRGAFRLQLQQFQELSLVHHRSHGRRFVPVQILHRLNVTNRSRTCQPHLLRYTPLPAPDQRSHMHAAILLKHACHSVSHCRSASSGAGWLRS